MELKGRKKTCVYCKKELFIYEFPKHKMHRDGYDSRCRHCIKERTKLIEEIRKTAPPKSAVCECCGKKPNIGENLNESIRKRGLALDHDPITKKFRGWLCNDCNVAIGHLGDTLNGVMMAVRYLKKYEKTINGNGK